MNRQVFGSVLLVTGILILAVAIFQYQDIRSAQREMLELHEQLAIEAENPAILQENSVQSELTAAPIQPILESKGSAKREDYQNGQMTIAIPKLEINAAVVSGTTIELLKKGPGLYESSPLPDLDGGNVCIAGHRTTYGAWFRHVDKLEEGDEITLDYDGSSYIYQVERVFIVDKKDWSITEPVGYSSLTLTACHPLRSSKQRIVVRGKLIITSDL
jgi:LPXTG-site transpeptidase (sortase) family protein